MGSVGEAVKDKDEGDEGEGEGGEGRWRCGRSK